MIEISELDSHTVTEWIIISVTSSIYQAAAVINGEQQVIVADSRPIRAKSLADMQKRLAEAGAKADMITLQHSSSYDEMIGQAQKTDNTLRTKVGTTEEL